MEILRKSERKWRHQQKTISCTTVSNLKWRWQCSVTFWTEKLNCLVQTSKHEVQRWWSLLCKPMPSTGNKMGPGSALAVMIHSLNLGHPAHQESTQPYSSYWYFGCPSDKKLPGSHRHCSCHLATSFCPAGAEQNELNELELLLYPCSAPATVWQKSMTSQDMKGLTETQNCKGPQEMPSPSPARAVLQQVAWEGIHLRPWLLSSPPPLGSRPRLSQ